MRTALLAALLGLVPASAQDPDPTQEPVLKWDVEIPSLVAAEAGGTIAPESNPVGFEVLNSRTKEVFVQQPAEMPDLPPVQGKVKVTVQRVADPGLADPPPALPASPPDDPAVLSRLEELRETFREPDLVFLSASVHQADTGAQEARTLLRIYPNGQPGKEVVAWSNVNFLHLTGQWGYRLTHEDGTVQDMGLLLGVSREYGTPEIPELPDLATAGPAFALVEGNSDSPAFATLEQLHDLFRKSGAALKDQYLAREQAREERKAHLIANPEKPKDVTIRVWRRTPTQAPTQEESR